MFRITEDPSSGTGTEIRIPKTELIVWTNRTITRFSRKKYAFPMNSIRIWLRNISYVF